MASAFLRNYRLYNSLHSPWRSSIFQSAPHESLHTSSFSSSSHQIYGANQYKLMLPPNLCCQSIQIDAFLFDASFYPRLPQILWIINHHQAQMRIQRPPPSASPEESSGNTNDGEKNYGVSQQGKPIRGGDWYTTMTEKRSNSAAILTSTAVKEGPSVGKAAIGGPFNLVDHDGKPVTEKSFLGQWNLIYFGFTHCPDICPDELQKLASAIDKIKEKSKFEVVPVFISVDPERDTVEQVREYVKDFHPKLIGLTGTSEEVKKAARAYRVYYMKAEEEDSSDYLVDHSIVMYLMDPNMEFVKFFGKNLDDTELANGIIQEIKQHKHKVVNV